MEAKTPRNGLKIAGYIVLGIFSFTFFLYIHFFVKGDAPAERILVPQLIKRAEQGNLKIKYDKQRVRGDLLFGVTLHDVEVQPKRRPALLQGSEEPYVEIDKLRVRLRPFTLLTGKLGVSIYAEAYQGELKGKVAAGTSRTVVNLEASDINIAFHRLLSNSFGVNPEGYLNGTVDFDVPMKEPDKRGRRLLDLENIAGTVSLALTEAGLAESNIMGFQKLPAISFSDAGVKAEVAGGNVAIEQLGLEGSDLSVSVDGDVKLRQVLAMSTMTGTLDLKIAPRIENELSPMLTGGIQGGKVSDGNYQFALRGPLRHLRPRPARAGKGGSGRESPRRRPR